LLHTVHLASTTARTWGVAANQEPALALPTRTGI
jgi:hypothetical protein